MTTHSPAADWNWNTETQSTTGTLNGKTLCGKSVTDKAMANKPSCGQCARNLRTVSGRMRDGRSLLAELWN